MEKEQERCVFRVPKRSTLHNTPYIRLQRRWQSNPSEESLFLQVFSEDVCLPSSMQLPCFHRSLLPEAIFALTSGQPSAAGHLCQTAPFLCRFCNPASSRKSVIFQTLPSCNTGRKANLFSLKDICPPMLIHCEVTDGGRKEVRRINFVKEEQSY